MRCPNCGRDLPAGVPSCPYCRVVLSFAVPPGGQASPGQLNPYVRVRSVRGVGLAAMIAVGLTAVVSVLLNLVGSIPSVRDSLLGASGDPSFALGALGVLLLLLSISLSGTVLSIIWLYRARKNV